MSQKPAGYAEARKHGQRPAEGSAGPFLVISEGTVFATDFERGCVALTIPELNAAQLPPPLVDSNTPLSVPA